MSWVSLTTEEQASPETKQIYKFLGENWGFVPNYFQALGGHPQLLQDQVNLFTHVMIQDEGRALPRIVREQIALVVSGINLSNYCLAAHLEILGRLGIDKKVSRKLALDYTTASVEPKVMALFRFADKLSRHPADDSSLPARSGTYDFSPDHRKTHPNCLLIPYSKLEELEVLVRKAVPAG